MNKNIADKKMKLQNLNTNILGQNYYYMDEVDSTNQFLKENAPLLPDGTACAATYQTAGRGRMGRDWSSSKKKSLMFSFLLHNFDPAAMAALPLVVGLGVSIALEKLCGVKAHIKWSNDVILDGRKICGILCESRLQGGNSFAVSGIGVNLTQSREELDALGLVYAASLLSVTKKEYDEHQVAAAILCELEPLLEEYVRDGFTVLHGRYTARCITLGCVVLLTAPDGGKREAQALGIARDGSLICSVNGKTEHINAGEVSVRGLGGYV